MKKSIQILATVVVMSGMLFTSCKGPVEKEVSSEIEMAEAQEALEEENRLLQLEVDAYRTSLNEKIASNELSIREFQTKNASLKSDAKVAYEKKISDLQAKNDSLRMRMSDFQSESKEDWEAFKSELNRDMEELGKAFKEFTIKN